MDLKSVYSKVFGWMFIGLLLTFLTGYTIANNLNLLLFLFEGNKLFIFAILEIVLVAILSKRFHKMSPVVAKFCFVLYSIFSGVTFSLIFLAYELGSIIYVFGITSVIFGIFAIIGHYTNVDLSRFGTYLLMGLLGIIICSIINVFIGSEGFDTTLCIVGLVIFLVYTAYDIQKVKQLVGSIPEENLAIYGALQLYLDFINIFLKLLRFFGKDRD